MHIWLPEVHAEASSSGSIILAGIILKLGVYGLIRFDFVILSAGTLYLGSLILVTSLIGSLSASMNCVRQYDIKKLMAYSSISHMNFAIAGLFALNIYAILSALITSYAHGLSSGALFTIAGIIYDRTQSRNVLSLQTLFNFYPAIASVIFIMILANLSFPGTINFIAELLSLISISNIDLALTALFLINIFISCV
jgi:NADH:ubiquinone oxidoreductase subunit 4 (subunit M)